ncbi:hypothetical protein SORBI_3003G170966 [Sorghum bicolor]|uniref:Secreted protein n=1 Tax=Sorghum bicolor TaxID=4558 RepID=A0A1W0VXP0_SORBI|nr:hypothetical protein SORBI_3003G170966 [Sorghum bicolor]
MLMAPFLLSSLLPARAPSLPILTLEKAPSSCSKLGRPSSPPFTAASSNPCSSLQWCIFHEDWSSPSLPASLGFVGDQDFLREAIKAT